MEGSSTGADAATVTRWFQIADPFGTYIGLAGCSARLGVWTVYGQDNGKPLVSGPCLASWQGGAHGPLWTAAFSLPKSVSVGYFHEWRSRTQAWLRVAPSPGAFLETWRE
jgi:hypothetical protein